MWNIGATFRNRSLPRSSGQTATCCRTPAIKPAWVWSTPFGMPVEPPVKRIIAGSSARGIAESSRTSDVS